ncbi:MAG: DUF3502 domain-containing protein [Clostridiales bacterium]|nr:DUF3502 domain-containing protein [Clostridiales bacterium]
MKVRRQLLALLICLLCTTLLSGCTGEAPETTSENEFPVLQLLTIGENSDEALNRVSDALSVLTEEKIGCHIELQNVSYIEYCYKMDNLLYDSTLPDMLLCLDRQTLQALTAGSYIVRLDQYLDDYPLLMAQIPADTWLRATDHGYYYGIPFGNSDIWYWGFVMRASVCDELGIDPSSIHDLDSLHSALLTVQSRTDLIPLVPDYGWVDSFTAYDPLDNGMGVYLYNEAEMLVTNYTQSKAFAERCKMMHQWYTQGLILETAAFDTLGYLDWLRDGNGFGGFDRIGEYTLQDAARVLGEEVYAVRLSENYQDRSTGSEMMCIASTSHDRNLCLSFLELLYSDAQILELCLYGVEGADYLVAEEGNAITAAADAEETFVSSWTWPRRLNARAYGKETSSLWSQANAQKSLGYGSVFDSDSVSTELYQCSLILDKYLPALLSGMVEPGKAIESLNRELHTSGIEAILRAKRLQWGIESE